MIIFDLVKYLLLIDYSVKGNGVCNKYHSHKGMYEQTWTHGVPLGNMMGRYTERGLKEYKLGLKDRGKHALTDVWIEMNNRAFLSHSLVVSTCAKPTGS